MVPGVDFGGETIVALVDEKIEGSRTGSEAEYELDSDIAGDIDTVVDAKPIARW